MQLRVLGHESMGHTPYKTKTGLYQYMYVWLGFWWQTCVVLLGQDLSALNYAFTIYQHYVGFVWSRRERANYIQIHKFGGLVTLRVKKNL